MKSFCLSLLTLLGLLVLSMNALAQQPSPPLTVTTYDSLTAIVNRLDQQSEYITNEVIGQSVNGRNIVAMKFSAGNFGMDNNKLKVLIFAQQHGNEQSGKEGALMLAHWLLMKENTWLLNHLDLALIPQVNPDGAEANKRRNGNNMDLNRNHLILTEPETQALHHFFDQHLFEVTLDVHEYAPYGDDWKQFGYRKNTEVALGGCTNLGVDKQLRSLANQEALPFMMDYIRRAGFSSFVYCPGGPPEIDYIRHSTFDINDGRQSFGIQQTFSFIQEGMNGEDLFADNISRRAAGQMTGMTALLLFAAENRSLIKQQVNDSRRALYVDSLQTRVSIQSIHLSDGSILELPLWSYFTGKDTVVRVQDYRPTVGTLTDVEWPEGYLIPLQNTDLLAWTARHGMKSVSLPENGVKFERYFIHAIDSIDFERDIIVDPVTEKSETSLADDTEYLFFPTAQLKGRLLVIAMEPKSMLGLVTYDRYKNHLKEKTYFPVIRVVKK